MDEVTFGIETRAAAAITHPTWETLELRRTIARTREEVAAWLSLLRSSRR